MRPRWLHPRRALLERWLDDRLAPSAAARVGSHVEGCDRCSQLLIDRADAGDAAPAQPALGAALRAVLGPPEGYTERAVATVDRRRSEPSMLAVLADLYGAGVETIRLIASDAGEEPADGEDER